jgi:hypothetical protein
MYQFRSFIKPAFITQNYLLFDLIQDKEVFQSFAQAQVSVTNEIFDYLGHPKFLFCPTQYCTTRAVPTVRNSEYLQTLGSKLAPEIQVSCYRPVQNEYGKNGHNVREQFFRGLLSEYQNRG